MLWSEVCKDFPNSWVVVEALSSHQINDEKTVDEVMVLDVYSDSTAAWKLYKQIKQQKPKSDFLIASTVNNPLKIKIKDWVGGPSQSQYKRPNVLTQQAMKDV